MPRNCGCAGGCGPDGVTRREFISLAGVGTAAAVLAGPSWARWVAAQDSGLADWKRSLHGPAAPRVYTSDKHTDARMHLGGIGTGNFAMGPDGRFTTWQLFNTLRDGHVPLFFGIKAGAAAKLLQTTGGPDLPRIARIEMSGEYPVATLRYLDPDLPVHVEMSAFSPFAPLDTRLSSMPAACFLFKVTNPTQQPQTVSLLAMMQNPVGYDAMGVPISFNSVGFNTAEERLTPEHPNFGGNVNEVEIARGGEGEKGRRGEADALTMLHMRAEAVPEWTLDRPLRLFTNLDAAALNTYPFERPTNLRVEGLEQLSATPNTERPAAATIILLEDASTSMAEPTLRAVRDAVEAGATLVFAGTHQALLRLYGDVTQGKPLDKRALRPDLVFEDFEQGYGRWRVEGTAFGTQPAHGTLPGQQEVSGFLGHGLVNSFVGGDDTTGKLISQPFTIERRYIRFLVGGGSHPGTQVRLVVDGKVVRAASGRNDERLMPATWDVREFAGKQAHIEIVDEAHGGWGHINVDQIEFADLPVTVGTLGLLDELLPPRFNDPRGARERPVGRGSVVLAEGSILSPHEVELFGARRRAYRALAEISGLRAQVVTGVPPKSPGFGTLTLATSGTRQSAEPNARDWRAIWEAFAQGGRVQPSTSGAGPSPEGQTVIAALASETQVPAGKSVEVPFFLTWRYPNRYNSAGQWIGSHYCTEWSDARAVMRELIAHFPAIREKTERFRNTFYDSTLPYWLLDCLTSQMSTIRHVGVLFRIANGDTYGWEGSNGCCEPTCTHVWGYEQTLARIFPDLERDMRRIDYKRQQGPDGGIHNRTDIPSPPHPSGERPFSDGHASCVLKAYREALNHPDDGWLREYWPNIKLAVQYLIGRDAGGEFGQGILADEQWNTYDNAIHGVNSFIGSYYLAALRAGEEMALRMGDAAFADRCRTIFERGRDNLVKRCWNGQYFFQDLPDYRSRSGEYGPGCLSDQLIGQWWAHQLDLGYLLPKEHVQKAMRSVFANNWLPDFSRFQHNWRKFAGGKDRGLLICTWPRGGRPQNTIPYVDEVWTGVEYQVAAHLSYEGHVDEAFAIVKGARDRYDGVPRPPIPRNPWNEIECGGHYARAMSSWSLLLALSGFHYDGPGQKLRFMPRYTPERFQAFFTGPEGWGTLRQTRRGKTQRNEIIVAEGRFAVRTLRLDASHPPKRVRVTLGSEPVAAAMKQVMEELVVELGVPAVVEPGKRLVFVLG